MTHKQKQAVGAALAAIFAAALIWLETNQPGPADGCQPCDCSGAVGLPGDATTLAADASAVTAVAK